MAEGLQYKIGADVKDFNSAISEAIGNLDKFDSATQRAIKGVSNNFKSLDKLETQLKSFEAGIKNATDPASFARLQRAIDATKQRIDLLNKPVETLSRGLGSTLPGAAVNGASALFSVGQVARDLPFGFIAIQNNLPQVIDQFAALSRSSGGVVGALRSVGSALAGPAGIAFAFGVVTAEITSLTQKYGSLGNALEAITKGSDKYYQQQKQLGEIQKAAAENAGEEIARLAVLNKVATDTTSTLANRKEAANELLKVYKEYLPNLTQEAILNNKAADAINRAKDAILAKALAAASEKKLAEVGGKLLDNQLKQVGAVRQYGAAQAAFSKQAQEDAGKEIQGREGVNLKLQQYRTEVDKAENKLSKIGEEAVQLQQEFDILTNLAASFAKQAGNAYVNDNTAGQKKNQQEAAALLKKQQDEARKFLQEKLDGYELEKKAIEDNFGTLTSGYRSIQGTIANTKATIDLIGVTDPKRIAEIKKNLETTLDNIADEFSKSRVAAGRIEVAPLLTVSKEDYRARWRAIFESINATGFEEALKLAPKKIPLKVNIVASPEVQKSIDDAKAKVEEIKKFSDAIQAQLQQSFANVFTSVGEGIGQVFSGVSNGFSAAQMVLSGLADILINVGKLAISTGVAILGIKKALQTLNPVVAIAGGVALVALGTAVKGKLSNSVPKFAEGGIVTRPTAGIFGEAGPEAIMPLDRLNKMIGNMGGSGSVDVTGEFLMRGNNLYAVVQKTAKQQGRAY